MTKKDYELIAKSINITAAKLIAQTTRQRTKEDYMDAIRVIVKGLAATLSDQNLNFKPDVFFSACGKFIAG